MKTRRALGALVAAVLGLAAAAPADAAVGTPPVTAPDTVTVAQGNMAMVQPLSNDTDADNDLLAICRLGTERHKGIQLDYSGAELGVQVGPNVAAGTYTYTYYACDFETLVPGTISVTVVDLPDITVKAIRSKPGKIRVSNPFDFKIRFLFGSFRSGGPDGKVLIAPRAKVVIPVERTKIDWIAVTRNGRRLLGMGHVKNIELSRGATPGASVPLPARLAAVWDAL